MQVKAKPVGAMPKKVVDKSVEVNPGSKDKQFVKTSQPQGKTGKTGSPSGPSNMKDVQYTSTKQPLGKTGKVGSSSVPSGMKDQQFNKKGQSPMGRAGSFGKSSNGSGAMKDKQFTDGTSYNDINDDGDASAGKKTSGTTKMQVAGQLSPAAKIMQAVAKFAQKPQGSIQKNKVSYTGVSSPKSASQSKSYKDSVGQGEAARAKSMNRGFAPSVKSAESSPGSKTAAVVYKGKGKGTGSV